MQPVTKLRLVHPGLLSVRKVATMYGLSKTSLYELIKSDPSFPYKNVGVKKRLMIEGEKFELWLSKRTELERNERFNIPSMDELLKRRKK